MFIALHLEHKHQLAYGLVFIVLLIMGQGKNDLCKNQDPYLLRFWIDSQLPKINLNFLILQNKTRYCYWWTAILHTGANKYSKFEYAFELLKKKRHSNLKVNIWRHHSVLLKIKGNVRINWTRSNLFDSNCNDGREVCHRESDTVS